MSGSDAVVGDIGQIAITVGNIASAKAFYGDVLGLRFLFDAGPNLAFLAAGPVRIMLTTPEGAGAVGHNSTLYFKVSDLDAAYAALARVRARSGRQRGRPDGRAAVPVTSRCKIRPGGDR